MYGHVSFFHIGGLVHRIGHSYSKRYVKIY